MDKLSREQASFCDNAGLAGVLIGLCCLFQHLYFMIPHIITITIIFIYLLAITSFFLLAKRSDKAPLLLLISCALLFIQEALMLIGWVFSLVLLLFFIYTLVIVILMYVSQLPKQLKLRAAAVKAEKAAWQGKI